METCPFPVPPPPTPTSNFKLCCHNICRMQMADITQHPTLIQSKHNHSKILFKITAISQREAMVDKLGVISLSLSLSSAHG